MKKVSDIETEVAGLINKAIDGLCANMTHNLADLVYTIMDKNREEADLLAMPTLIVWVDSVEVLNFGTQVGAFVRFGDDIEKVHGDELRFGFDGALTYFDLACAVAALNPLLSSRNTVRRLAEAARPRMMANHFGVAA